MFGLITGSGFYDLPDLAAREQLDVPTPFGSVEITRGVLRGHPVVFLPRHGADHSVPPAGIDYRANVWALRDVGATSILATAVSGGIDPALGLGAFVAISDFLDFTSGRAVTFFDGVTEPFDSATHHTDMTEPYDPVLRAHVIEAARIEGIEIADTGVYATANGPRFETPAEIRMMRLLGAHLVGMTGYPEVALAREAGIPYASIGIISNPAAGLGAGELSADDIFGLVDRVSGPLHRLIDRTITLATAGHV